MVDALTSKLVDITVDLVKDEVSMLCGARDDLNQLATLVQQIQPRLQAAEFKAFTDNGVRGWLAELRGIVYDADDVIDYYKFHMRRLIRSSLEQTSSLPMLVRCYSPFLLCFQRVALNHEVGNRIRSINNNLERVFKNMSHLNLIAPATSNNGRSSSERVTSRPSATPTLEPVIVGTGIHIATEQLVSLLVARGGSQISILSIEGMGGIGKTTLAQNIFNHPTTKSNFKMPPPMWVSITKEYNEINLMKEIIKRAGGQPGGAESLIDLESKLIDVIKDRVFFLILDDVWDAKVWENLLRKPLSVCAPGSKIVITTRDDGVANQMGASFHHKVEQLTKEEGWSLLHKMLFLEGDRELLTNVEDIGKQIVEKCNGHPLAIRSIAGVLRMRVRSRSNWSIILQDLTYYLGNVKDGDSVMGILFLSYQDLPSHLKQCFLSCSFYPEGLEFHKDDCCLMWIAEGFLEEKDNIMIEDKAEMFFDDLVARNILQKSFKNELQLLPTGLEFTRAPLTNALSNIHDQFTMHPLYHSLAQSLVGNENFCGDFSKLENSIMLSSPRLHRVFLNCNTGSISPLDALRKKMPVRTLRLTLQDSSMQGNTLQDVLTRLPVLRLFLCSGLSLTKLPECLGHLIHLRYLNLSESLLTELPKSIGNLHNLQIMLLDNCSNLEKLPMEISSLYNLRTLSVGGTTNLRGMPKGLGRLQYLNQIRGFTVNENNAAIISSRQSHEQFCSLEELSSLSQLRRLELRNLSALLALRNNYLQPGRFLLKDKSRLVILSLDVGNRLESYGEETPDAP